MPPVFSDTSAFLAALNPADQYHEQAASLLSKLAARRTRLFTTSYVLLETYALVGRRLGVAQARNSGPSSFLYSTWSGLNWVEPTLHDRGLDAWLDSGSRDLSLVDTVSFALLEEMGLQEALAFDGHFTDRGFVLPE